jgi:hypothetical protein
MSADENLPMDTIIFSMVDGTVWVSWPGKSGSVELGHSDAVTYMMRDFLAQCELGERMGLGKRAKG